VVDATVPQNRPKTQGTIDVLIALAGAGGGMVSGAVMHATSYQVLSIGGGILAILLSPVVGLLRVVPGQPPHSRCFTMNTTRSP